MKFTENEKNLILRLIDHEKNKMTIFEWIIAKNIKKKIGGIE